MLSWFPCSACKRRADPVKAAAEDHRTIGHAHVKKQEYTEAVSAYSKAISLQSKDASLWVCRARVYEDLQDWQQSLRDATRAVQLNPDNKKAVYSKVLALRKLGKFDDALKECDAALESHPKNYEIKECRDELQELAKKEKQNREAKEEAEKAEAAKKVVGAKKDAAGKAAPKPTKKYGTGTAVPAKTSPATAVKKASLDYSKFDGLGSDDEEEEKEKEAAAKKWDGPNPALEERLGLVEDMLELCRKTHKENVKYFGDNKTSVRAKLPPDYKRSVGVLSEKELAEYKCSADRMLVSIYGDIFDVSSRPDLYGYGPRSMHSGKDITWGVVTGDEKVSNFNRFYDVFKLDDEHRNRFLQIICQRMVSFEDEFGEPVGRLEPFVNERELPPAPKDEIEECTTQ